MEEKKAGLDTEDDRVQLGAFNNILCVSKRDLVPGRYLESGLLLITYMSRIDLFKEAGAQKLQVNRTLEFQ